MTSRLRRSASSERGSMAIEVVGLTPVLVAVLLLVVAAGKYVDRVADVEAVARDAARAATLERSASAAQIAADRVVSNAESRLYDGATCDPVAIGGTFAAGQTISVTVRCQLPWSGLGFIGLSGSLTIERDAQSPLDQWRRTE